MSFELIHSFKKYIFLIYISISFEFDICIILYAHITSIYVMFTWQAGLSVNFQYLLNPALDTSCLCTKLLQSCPTLCNPVDHNLPSSSVRGILRARILEWVAIPFSRGSSQPRKGTGVSCVAGRFFTVWATFSSDSSSISFVRGNQVEETL